MPQILTTAPKGVAEGDTLQHLDCVRSVSITAQILGMTEPMLRKRIAKGYGPKITRMSKTRFGIRDSDREAWLAALNP